MTVAIQSLWIAEKTFLNRAGSRKINISGRRYHEAITVTVVAVTLRRVKRSTARKWMRLIEGLGVYVIPECVRLQMNGCGTVVTLLILSLRACHPQ